MIEKTKCNVGWRIAHPTKNDSIWKRNHNEPICHRLIEKRIKQRRPEGKITGGLVTSGAKKETGSREEIKKVKKWFYPNL